MSTQKEYKKHIAFLCILPFAPVPSLFPIFIPLPSSFFPKKTRPVLPLWGKTKRDFYFIAGSLDRFDVIEHYLYVLLHRLCDVGGLVEIVEYGNERFGYLIVGKRLSL